ncbi:peptidoglycan DD-metalloendopeptidase family protein [Streptomyces sp. NPDC047130]|uniref:peptidoglycan DD-metalloendopeptidase family protein n=1 Tax=Streptomyces sp. NPDC047130 TaxID=3155261 RepID=UPI0033CE6741
MFLALSRRVWPVALAAVSALLSGLLLTPLAAAAPAEAAAAYTGFCPATGYLSQGHHAGHNGIDIAAPTGTPIYAVGPGEVTISGHEPGYGQWIRILHPDGSTTEYGHMYHRDVQVGDRVAGGQRIALMGSEGQSTGPHLHLRVWARPGVSVDPVPYLAERGIRIPCFPGPGPAPAPPVHPAESGRVVSARGADGRLELFAAGADGVHHAWQTDPNSDWSAWEFLGGPGDAQLAVGPNKDGRLELFAVNGSVFEHMYQLRPSGAWSGWENFGTGGHDVAVGSNGDGRLEVFASGPVGVFHKYQTAPNSGWSAWEPTGGPANSAVETEKAPDGRLEVFALNGETFQHLYQTRVNGGWSAWEAFGEGGHDLTVDHNQDGRLEVFASGPVGVFHKYQTNATSWSAWEPTGGLADAQLTSQRTPDNRVEVFAINETAAQHIWQTGVNARYGGWEAFGTGGAEITATANADGRIEVFGTSHAGVYHKWQTGHATWSDWAWLNSTAGPPVD